MSKAWAMNRDDIAVGKRVWIRRAGYPDISGVVTRLTPGRVWIHEESDHILRESCLDDAVFLTHDDIPDSTAADIDVMTRWVRGE